MCDVTGVMAYPPESAVSCVCQTQGFFERGG